MLAAGFEGIKKEYELRDPVEKNIYRLTDRELKALGIESLPGSLGEAIAETENSDLARRALGDHVFYYLIELTQREWDDCRVNVTLYEIARYLPIL
jgi:glutamine synthetase